MTVNTLRNVAVAFLTITFALSLPALAQHDDGFPSDAEMEAQEGIVDSDFLQERPTMMTSQSGGVTTKVRKEVVTNADGSVTVTATKMVTQADGFRGTTVDTKTKTATEMAEIRKAAPADSGGSFGMPTMKSGEPTVRMRPRRSAPSAPSATPIKAAPVAKEDEGPDIKPLWEDLMHYIKIAHPLLAPSTAKAILESGAAPEQVYLLWADTPDAVAVLKRGSNLKGMKQLVDDLQKMIDTGFVAVRKDPKQIDNAIKMLGGTFRGYEIAARALEKSGEYALPQLIQKLAEPTTPMTLREKISRVLPRLGKDAVRPLSAALQTNNPALQEEIAKALGEIGYPHAAGRLKELLARENLLPGPRKAATRALIACSGTAAQAKSTAAIFYDQSLSYYYCRESIQPAAADEMANVWYWKKGAGLAYKAVPKAIFCDIYAMRMARLALQHDPTFYPAVSLWVGANLNRLAHLPEGQTDVTYGENTPTVAYFALASSARYLQDVLARALKDHNSPVAIGAIEALSKTAGARNLIEPVSGGAQPLVEALGYPDRHVRFLAAVSLANALPTKRFLGDELVITQLIEALRQTGRQTALVIIQDERQRNAVKDAMRDLGYDIIDNVDLDEAIRAARQSAGVDVAILSAKPNPSAIVARFRTDPVFATLPAIIVSDTERVATLIKRDDSSVQLKIDIDQGELATADMLRASLAEARKLTAGSEMTGQAAAMWTVRAANAIEHLGTTGNAVYDIKRAQGALAAALGACRRPVRLAASKALSVTQTPDAQRAIAALALSTTAPEDVRVAAFNDLSASLRRFGMHLTEELSQAVLAVVKGEGSSDLLNSAAQALGAMDLPSQEIKSLILTTSN